MHSLLLAQDEAAAAGLLIFFGLFYLAFIVLFIAAGWKLFTKAGEDGWKILVPIYNLYVMLQIVGRPGWWLLLMMIPFVNLVVAIIVYIDLAKSFGKDAAFGIGLVFLSPIFFPILAFGDSRYIGPAGPEPRPGYPSLGQGGYPQQGYGGQQWGQQGIAQGGYQPPPGQQWGQPPQQPPGQWGQPGQSQPQQPPGQWGQPGQPQQPPGGQGGGYPPPPI